MDTNPILGDLHIHSSGHHLIAATPYKVSASYSAVHIRVYIKTLSRMFSSILGFGFGFNSPNSFNTRTKTTMIKDFEMEREGEPKTAIVCCSHSSLVKCISNSFVVEAWKIMAELGA